VEDDSHVYGIQKDLDPNNLSLDQVEIENQQVIAKFLSEEIIPESPTIDLPHHNDLPHYEPIENDFSNEKLDKNHIYDIKSYLEQKLGSMNYFLIQRSSLMVLDKGQHVDLMAIKVLKGEKDSGLILIFPIKICMLKGTLLISDDMIDYRSSMETQEISDRMKVLILKSDISSLMGITSLLYHNISEKGSLFKFLQKYLKINLSIEKSKNQKNVFLRSGLFQYKVLVEPILACNKAPASLQKITLFTYQKPSNSHFVNYRDLKNLVRFLEKKWFSIETYSNEENQIKTYFNAMDTFNNELKRYSIPFIAFGLLFLLLIIFQANYLINTFIGLSLAAIFIYITIIFYSYLKLHNKKSEISKQFNLPYYLKTVKLDETDLMILNEELTPEELDQFIYECYGKKADFKIITKLEERKSQNRAFDTLHRTNDSKGISYSTRPQNKNKYSTFLED